MTRHIGLIDIGNSAWKATVIKQDDSSHAFLGTHSTDSASHSSSPCPPPVVKALIRSNKDGLVPTTGSLEHSIADWFHQLRDQFPPPDHWLIASVSRHASESLDAHLQNLHAKRHWIQYRHVPLQIEVDFPERVGIDRLLAAVGARQRVPHGPLIIVQSGTAVTVDYLSAENAFTGGAILPNAPLILASMAQGTDGLPWLATHPLVGPTPTVGKNTEQAMRLGALACVAGGVTWLASRYDSLSPNPQIVLTGGDAMALAPWLESQGPLTAAPDLVLAALASLAPSVLSDFDD